MCVGDSRSLLSEEELKQLVEACDMALELNQSKHRIYEYVESRMSFIAPNLSIIVGASTAAKLMGEEGGFQSCGGVDSGSADSVSFLCAPCRYCRWPDQPVEDAGL